MTKQEVNARVRLLQANSVAPDWTIVGSVRKFISKFPSFKGKFKGVGWYFEKDDAMLIAPGGVGTLKTGDVGKPIYCFMVYNYRDPRNVFMAVANAPVKLDKRVAFSRTMRLGKIEVKERTPHGFYISERGRKLPSSHCRFCGIARRRDKARRWGLWEYLLNDGTWTRECPPCRRSKEEE